MNCKNCGYGLKQSCGDFEKIICTYEEGECVKITELEKQLEETKLQNAICEEGLKKQIAEVEQEVKLWKKASENNSYKAFQLKHENTELKEQNTNLQEMLKTERSVTCKEEYLKKVTELEQENAELKAKNKWYSEQVCNKECAEVWGNLDKAKEIIKTFLGFAEAFGYSPSMDKFISEAKQFISEEEK